MNFWAAATVGIAIAIWVVVFFTLGQVFGI